MTSWKLFETIHVHNHEEFFHGFNKIDHVRQFFFEIQVFNNFMKFI